MVGHVGDGNFHVQLVFDRTDDGDLEKVHGILKRLAARALAMEGTCTGEHGVGVGKKKYLDQEHGPALNVMRTIKRAIDPDNIMNPGKIIEV